MPKAKKELFLVIDSNSIFHRAYHALPRFETKKGELVNAVYGFSLILMKAIKEFKPQYIVAAFDVAGPTFRNEQFAEYKATREKAPDELYEQIPRIKEVLKVFNIPIYEKEGFEADDILGTVSNIIESNYDNIEIMLVSGDLDILQLVSKKTRVYTMKKSVQDTVIYDQKAVKERFGIKPTQLMDFKGLRGDASDNIPGVPGVGEKTASILLQKYKNLEELYEALKKNKVTVVSERIKNILEENKEQAFFSRMLATIIRDVSIDFDINHSKWGGFNPKEAEKLFNELNFKRLINQLASIEGFETLKIKPSSSDASQKEELLKDIQEANDAGILSNDLYQLEKDLVDIILSMERAGIKIDKKALLRLEEELEKKLKTIEQKIYKEAGEEFNINSPQQLSEILFGKLNISTKGLRKTPGKKISTAASELEKLKGEHSIIENIFQQRELQKLLTTYIKPLPKLADNKDRIHTTFKPLGTATGRMSSKEPNLQNIPMRGSFAKKIRQTFIAEKGNTFLSCDYSQMELRIIAHMAKDKKMINVFKQGEDIHINTAAFIFNVPKEDVSKIMRYRAKALNFGIIYGIGPKAFAESAEINFEEAKEFIQKYLDIFDGVAAFMESTKQKAHKTGYAETMFGRKRFLADLRSPNPMLRSYAERAAINHPIQGTAADIVKMAMIKSSKELKNVDLLLQIHDELLWEGESDTISKIAPKAKNILENIVKLAVPLDVQYKIGSSWGNMK